MLVNEKRKVLVTGAASGIGAAICRQMANDQTAFLLHTRSNKKGLDEIAKFIESVGGQTEKKLSDNLNFGFTVKCFSIICAPAAAANGGMFVPGVWSECPIGQLKLSFKRFILLR